MFVDWVAEGAEEVEGFVEAEEDEGSGEGYAEVVDAHKGFLKVPEG